jgi:hypothetical protein
MYCSQCGCEAIPESTFCAGCGAVLGASSSEPPPVKRQISSRPVAGIAVATVLGGIGLLWACAQLFSSLSSAPGGVQAALFITFPGLQEAQFTTTAAGMLGNAAVLIGALMSFLFHPNGAKVVRVASWVMLVAVVLSAGVTGTLVTNSAAWPSLDAPTKGGLIGGVVGGAIGGALQWGLILFLFRKAIA